MSEAERYANADAIVSAASPRDRRVAARADPFPDGLRLRPPLSRRPEGAASGGRNEAAGLAPLEGGTFEIPHAQDRGPGQVAPAGSRAGALARPPASRRTLRLVEPLGLLAGAEAADAVAAGLALPFMGGPAAFTLARLHAPGAAPGLVRAPDIPAPFRDALARLVAAPPDAALPPGPLVMAILNATPDSFSDAGRHLDPARAIEAGRRFVAEGAALLDIGGESTRPGAVPPSVDEEIRRIAPLLDGLRDAGAILSVDTRRAAVMRAALDRGARMVNDVSGLAHDPDAIPLLAGARCTVAIMHMRGTPETMASLATYRDVVPDVVSELAARVDAAVAGGIERARIVVDPGIGFAKTAEHNLALLRRLPILANLGARVLLGVSRKSFLARLAGPGGSDPAARGPATLAASTAARAFPDPIHRVHDVASLRQFLAVETALSGRPPTRSLRDGEPP